jgi:hypothetical protein
MTFDLLSITFAVGFALGMISLYLLWTWIEGHHGYRPPEPFDWSKDPELLDGPRRHLRIIEGRNVDDGS